MAQITTLSAIGLEKIVRSKGAENTLPSVAIPSSIGSSKILPSPITEAIAPPNLEDLLASSFTPPLQDGTVLLPMNFKNNLTHITDTLIKTAHSAKPNDQAKLLDAADVLTRLQTDLVELDQRRSALIRG